MENKKIKIVLGTMTIGEQLFENDVKEFLATFLKSGNNIIDTAYVYNDGNCEKLLGMAIPSIDRDKIKIDTKVNPRVTGRLDQESILMQVNESINRLRTSYVDTLYLHFPQMNMPLEEVLGVCQSLYEEKKIRRIGLSNFPAWLVSETVNICDRKNWIRPSVYEGLYNPLSRNAEKELDLALSYFGISFYAYNPLAGGMLTNKYTDKTEGLKQGRFTYRPNYQARYWKDSYFEAIRNLKKVCLEENIDIVEATFRYLLHHSMLKVQRGDGIILGASSVSQLEKNLQYCRKGFLSKKLIKAMDQAWECTRAEAPEYFRFYSSK